MEYKVSLEELLKNVTFAPLWMQKYLKEIGGLNNESNCKIKPTR